MLVVLAMSDESAAGVMRDIDKYPTTVENTQCRLNHISSSMIGQ